MVDARGRRHRSRRERLRIAKCPRIEAPRAGTGRVRGGRLNEQRLAAEDVANEGGRGGSVGRRLREESGEPRRAGKRIAVSDRVGDETCRGAAKPVGSVVGHRVARAVI